MFQKFENLVDPFAIRGDDTPPSALWAYIRTQLKPFHKWLPWMALTGFLVAIMESGLVFYSGRLIDLMNDAGPAAFWHSHKTEVVFVALFILFLRPLIITFNHLFLEQTLASNMQEQARWRAHRHMLGQSSTFFQNDFAGRLSNRVMQIGPSIEDNTYMAFEGIWYSFTYVIGATLVLSQIDYRLGIPMLVWLLLYVLYVKYIALRVAVASEKWSDARSMVNGRVVDAYSNIETVKLFAHGAREEAYALSALRRLRLRFQRFLRLMTELSFGLNALNGLLMIGVLGPAIWLWMSERISVGEVAAASALVIRLNGMSGWIMWVVIRLFENAGTIRESLQSIAVEQDVVDAKNAKPLQITNAAIEIDNLVHHYGKGRGGLDGVSLSIPAGQKVGLIGRSGAGKSSLVNLLLRFRDAEGGTIRIDGQAVSEVTQDSLRQQIGMVTQDSSLLHRSVRANILYGKPDATEGEMITAAERAEAHSFIQDLQDPKGRSGYDAQVGERGVKLSGGQRQRIAIARAILRDAPILLLDEATSALDAESENAVQRAVEQLSENRTTLIVAHRLATVKKADRILVFDGGEIVAQGSHNSLVGEGGLYARLAKLQFTAGFAAG